MYKLRDYQQKASDAAVFFFNNKTKENKCHHGFAYGKWQIAHYSGYSRKA